MRPFLNWIVLGTLVSAFPLVTVPANAQQYWDVNSQLGRYRFGYLNNHYYGPYTSTDKAYQAYYYFYQPQPGARYRSHTVYYDPRTDYFYYLNGQSHKFWGRCRLGTNNYEILAPENQRERLSELDDRSFQPLGRMPNVPDMTPATALVPPPSRMPPRRAPYTITQPPTTYSWGPSAPANSPSGSADVVPMPATSPPPPAPADSAPTYRPGRGRGGAPSAAGDAAPALRPGRGRGGEK